MGCDSVVCINAACRMHRKNDLDIAQVSRSESEDNRGPPEGTLLHLRSWTLALIVILWLWLSNLSGVVYCESAHGEKSWRYLAAGKLLSFARDHD